MSQNRNGDETTVLLAVKTPMMARASTFRVPGHWTPTQALSELQKKPPKDDANATRILQQLAAETRGQHSYLAVTKENEVVKIDPHKTTLLDLAIPHEVQTSQGLMVVPVAAPKENSCQR